MLIPSLPSSWRERSLIVWPWSATPEASGVLARTFFEQREIRYYHRPAVLAPVLLAWLWPWLLLVVPVYLVAWICVVRHERGHARGIPATGCVAGATWCVMTEAQGQARDTWTEKLQLLPRQIFIGWGRYCPACRKVIEEGDDSTS